MTLAIYFGYKNFIVIFEHLILKMMQWVTSPKKAYLNIKERDRFA